MIDIKYYWQISKYKKQELPLYEEGAVPSWTSFSDIGKSIDGKILTIGEYLGVENLFIQTINIFMNCSNTSTLIVKQLEKPFTLKETKEKYKQKGISESFLNKLCDYYELVTEEMIVDINEIEYLSRLALRENLWIQLQSESMFLRFDYDYYIDIGSTETCEEAVIKTRKWGLTVNQWNKPYPFELFT